MEREHWQLRCAELKQRGAYLYKSKIWADCEFQLDQVIIKAHKLVMAMASPVFSKMLYGGPLEGPVPIFDVRVEVFNILLEYIYSDTLNISSSKDACDLYYVAKKWRLPFMAKECVKYLNENMSPANVCHIYCVACESNDEELQKACEKVFSEKTKEVLNESSFNKLSIDIASKLFSLDTLNIDNELDLYLAAVKYARAQDIKELKEYWREKRHNLKRVGVDIHNIEDNDTSEEVSPPKKFRSLTEDATVSDADEKQVSPSKTIESSQESDSFISPSITGARIRDGKEKLKYRALVNNIRFLTLTPQEFAECRSLHSLLTTQEILALSMNICSRETHFEMPEGLSTNLVPRTLVTKEDRARIAAVFRSTIPNFKHLKKYESTPFYLRNMAWTFMVIIHSEYQDSVIIAVTCFYNAEPGEWVKNTKVRVRFCTHKPVPKHLHKIALKSNDPTLEYATWATKVDRSDLLNPEYSFVDDFNTVTYKLYINTVPRPNENESPDHEMADFNLTSSTESHDSNIILKVTKSSQPQVTASTPLSQSSPITIPAVHTQQSPVMTQSQPNSKTSRAATDTIPQPLISVNPTKSQQPSPVFNPPIPQPIVTNYLPPKMPAVANNGPFPRQPSVNSAVPPAALPNRPPFANPYQQLRQPVSNNPMFARMAVDNLMNKISATASLAANLKNNALEKILSLEQIRKAREIEIARLELAQAARRLTLPVDHRIPHAAIVARPIMRTPPPSIHHSYSMPPSGALNRPPPSPKLTSHQILRPQSPSKAPLPFAPKHISPVQQISSSTSAPRTVNNPPSQQNLPSAPHQSHSQFNPNANLRTAEIKPKTHTDQSVVASVPINTSCLQVKSPVKNSSKLPKSAIDENFSKSLPLQSCVSRNTSTALETAKPHTSTSTVTTLASSIATPLATPDISITISNPSELSLEKSSFSDDLTTIQYSLPPSTSGDSRPLHAVTQSWPTKTTTASTSLSTMMSSKISTCRCVLENENSSLTRMSDIENVSSINPIFSELESLIRLKEKEVNNNIDVLQPSSLGKIALERLSMLDCKDSETARKFELEKNNDRLKTCDTLLKLCLQKISSENKGEITMPLRPLEQEDDIKTVDYVAKSLKDSNANKICVDDIKSEDFEDPFFQPPTLMEIAFSMIEPLKPNDFEYLLSVEMSKSSKKNDKKGKPDEKLKQPQTLRHIAFAGLSPIFFYNFLNTSTI